jgi:hypothetical protein
VIAGLLTDAGMPWWGSLTYLAVGLIIALKVSYTIAWRIQLREKSDPSDPAWWEYPYPCMSFLFCLFIWPAAPVAWLIYKANTIDWITGPPKDHRIKQANKIADQLEKELLDA